MVVKPLNMKGFIYYGLNTGWLSQLIPDEYETRKIKKILSSKGDMYFIYDKKGNKKWGIFKNVNGKNVINLYDDLLSNEDIKQIKTLISPDNKKIFNEILGSSTFKFLRKFMSGKISDEELEDVDKLINTVYVDSRNLSDSIVILYGDFLEMSSMSDESIWFINRITSSYLDFTDAHREWDDLLQGYGIFRYFNTENTNKLEKISSYLLPNDEFDLENEKFVGVLAREFDSKFERYLNNMIYDYVDVVNLSASKEAEKIVEKELNEMFAKYGLTFTDTDYKKAETTVLNLFELYLNNFKLYDDLTQLFESIFSKDRDIPDYENWYEFQDLARWDNEELNNKFESNLDDVLEKISDDEDFKKRSDIISRLKEEFNFGYWTETSYNPNILFKIKSVDEEGKIVVELKKLNGKKEIIKSHAFSEDNFRKFINNPEIFSIFDQ